MHYVDVHHDKNQANAHTSVFTYKKDASFMPKWRIRRKILGKIDKMRTNKQPGLQNVNPLIDCSV